MPLRIALLLGVLAACAPCLACAEDAAAWLDGAAAKRFRDRVVELALIYDASSGIDPAGYKVEARRTAPLVRDCAPVEVRTSRDGQALRRESLRACRHGARH
jgi:hypothetical protein